MTSYLGSEPTEPTVHTEYCEHRGPTVPSVPTVHIRQSTADVPSADIPSAPTLDQYRAQYLGMELGPCECAQTQERAMLIAMEISALARGISSPNPPVGAVVLDADGRIRGLGATRAPGKEHAEIVALAMANDYAKGGLLAVTLEPCNHWGKTPPCVDAIIKSGISTVVYAVSEPTQLAHGGATRIRAAACSVYGGVCSEKVRNGPLREWLFAQEHGRPYISAKIAMSIDGRITVREGIRQQLTNEYSRVHAHNIRRELDAIIIGTGTCLIDNPHLSARDANGNNYRHQPQRVVIGDTHIPEHYHVREQPQALFLPHIATEDVSTFFATYLPSAVNVLLEGGPTLLGSFFRHNHIDRLYLYIAPILLGTGQLAFTIPGLSGTDARWWQKNNFCLEHTTRLGNDVLLVYSRLDLAAQ